MVEPSVVVAALRKLLPTLDLELATQRSISDQLEEVLGVPVAEHKALIRQEIDQYLIECANIQGEEQQQPEEEEEEQPPTKKPKHDSSDVPVPSGEHGFELASKRFAQVRVYSGRPLVDIREYYDKDGELAPGSKGLSLTAAQFSALVDNMQHINQAAHNQDESFFVELSDTRRASISGFKGKIMIDLREYYSKDGKMMPGKKGISLPPDQWAKLCAIHEILGGQLEAQGGSALPASSTKKQQQPSTSTAAPVGGNVVVLSSNRRAEISEFKGKSYANIREYYEKDGQQLPGKKGISLPQAQFDILKSNASQITAALEAATAGYEVKLADKRKVTISDFKGKNYVNIREYYEKDGKELPGAKGISLNVEQWSALVGGLDTLQAGFNNS